MKAKKVVQPQRRGTGAEKRMAAIEAAHPVVESNNGLAVLNPDERRQMIARAAYFRAQSRGFTGGSPEQDWYEAEAEIDGLLSGAD